MDHKQKKIEKIFSKLSRYFEQIHDESSINKIYDLFVNNIIFKPTCDIEIFYLGRYYEIIKEDYEMMKKYYLMLVDNNNYCVDILLSNHYSSLEFNYKLSKQYYLMCFGYTGNKIINSYFMEKITYLDRIEMWININHSRDTIISNLNHYVSIFDTQPLKDQNTFIQLIKNFDFYDNDNIHFDLFEL